MPSSRSWLLSSWSETCEPYLYVDQWMEDRGHRDEERDRVSLCRRCEVRCRGGGAWMARFRVKPCVVVERVCVVLALPRAAAGRCVSD